jgi:hypothetical protein
MARDVTKTRYSVTEILIIAAYALILLLIAVLVWKLLGPILAIVISGVIAYIIDLRKLIGRKN